MVLGSLRTRNCGERLSSRLCYVQRWLLLETSAITSGVTTLHAVCRWVQHLMSLFPRKGRSVSTWIGLEALGPGHSLCSRRTSVSLDVRYMRREFSSPAHARDTWTAHALLCPNKALVLGTVAICHLCADSEYAGRRTSFADFPTLGKSQTTLLAP